MGKIEKSSVGFGSPEVAARIIRGGSPVRLGSRSVVVNLSDRPAFVEGPVRGFVPPRLSTIVDGAAVSGELLLAIAVPDEALAEAYWRDAGWTDFYARDGKPVLLRSPQTAVGTVDLDAAAALGGLPSPPEAYEVRVNLWFSPAGTACGIHNIHDFLEVHTQITGTGAMQKFSAPDAPGPFEEQFLAPGTTSPAAFCRVEHQTFIYPWHQYQAVTDCLWLAVEYHRC